MPMPVAILTAALVLYCAVNALQGWRTRSGSALRLQYGAVSASHCLLGIDLVSS